jgi:Protein of unknown function (DUF3455)
VNTPNLRRAFRLTNDRSGSTVEPRNQGHPGKLGLKLDKENLMTRHNARTSRTLSRRGWTPYLVVVAGVCLAMLSPGLYAQTEGPDVPTDLEVPAGHKLFLRARAIGTQNYICLLTDSGFGWAFFGPQATLFKFRRQIITHFLSPNPDEEDLPRATWQHSQDTSRVWGNAVASSSDPSFVEPGAIPWLLLEVVGAEPGPAGGTRLTETVYIQRIRTSGGVAPATGCDDQDPNVGARALVPYEADYLFYKPIFPR